MESAATPSENFLHRASEIDIDYRKACFDKPHRSGSELFRFCSHQLTGDWLFFRRIE
jgi:hypothetical protein